MEFPTFELLKVYRRFRRVINFSVMKMYLYLDPTDLGLTQTLKNEFLVLRRQACKKWGDEIAVLLREFVKERHQRSHRLLQNHFIGFAE